MFGRRRPVPPDPALLARVIGDAEVDLGTYSLGAVALVGAGSIERPVRDRRLQRFGWPDDQTRDDALRSGLGQLIADGTLERPATASLEDICADGLNGKLTLHGPLATVCDLSYWIRRRRERFSLTVSMSASDGLQDVRLPDGTRVPTTETCFGLPLSKHDLPFLVERLDNLAGTFTYTLRTARREFQRMEDFLFSEVTTPGERLQVSALMTFQTGTWPAMGLISQHEYHREHGDDAVACQVRGFAPSLAEGMHEAHRFSMRVPHGELAGRLTASFYSGAKIQVVPADPTPGTAR